MIRAAFPILFTTLAWPAVAAENPCQNVEKDPAFTTCWREAACRVDTYESKDGSGFSVYWDRCRIKMNEARAIELQHMIDSP